MKLFQYFAKYFFALILMVLLTASSALLVAAAAGETPASGAKNSFYVGLQQLSPAQIHQVLPGTQNKAVFLEFKSKFCLACKKMDPLLEDLLPKYPHVEKRIYDMMLDRGPHADVFNAFKPTVVPIQVYINTKGDVVNVFYDYHSKEELQTSLNCIDPDHAADKCLLNQAGGSVSWQKQLEDQVNKAIAAGSVTMVIFAFLAGIASSFFPCTLAMLPVLVGYIGGYSGGSKRDVFLQVTLFILGLATVMTVLGVVLSAIGMSFGQQNSTGLYIAVAVLCIVMGLQMMEVFHLPLPRTITTLPETKQGKLTTFYILGCAFGLVASPCGTPVLAAILGIISKQGNILLGGVSLFAYALGQGVLLMFAGLFTGLLKHKAAFFKVGAVLTKVSGALIILVGIAFLLQAFGVWTQILTALNIAA